MDQLFTSQFWRDQFAVVWAAPWAIIPLLLIAGGVGWKWKAANDDGEIRELRAKADAAAERLELAREKYQTVVGELNELRDKIAKLDTKIAKLKKGAITSDQFDELKFSNTKIKNSLTNLSTSTSSLGEVLRIIPSDFKGGSTSGSG
jgi:septal ring factor EnvC (AmiA/AmiB activator)